MHTSWLLAAFKLQQVCYAVLVPFQVIKVWLLSLGHPCTLELLSGMRDLMCKAGSS